MKHDEYDRFCDCAMCKKGRKTLDLFRRLRKAMDEHRGVRLSQEEITLIIDYVEGRRVV